MRERVYWLCREKCCVIHNALEFSRRTFSVAEAQIRLPPDVCCLNGRYAYGHRAPLIGSSAFNSVSSGNRILKSRTSLSAVCVSLHHATARAARGAMLGLLLMATAAEARERASRQLPSSASFSASLARKRAVGSGEFSFRAS